MTASSRGSRRRSRSTCGTIVAEWLGLERSAVRVVAPDVGGGFGSKLHVYPEYLICAAAALRLGRPVAWQESRSESIVGLNHGRAQIHDVELGATRDGTLVGLRVDILADMGAYPAAAYLPVTTKTMLPGVYRLPRVAARGRAVVTNTVPVGEYRGAGRPEAAASIERAIDLLAARARDRPGRAPAPQPDPRRGVPVHHGRRLALRRRRLRAGRSTTPFDSPITTGSAAGSPNAGSAATLASWASASPCTSR